MRKHLSTTVGLTVSGLAFIAYPALRPWGLETGASGAATFGSTAWPVSHSLGMLGFIALAFALRAAVLSAPWLRRTEGRMWFALAMLLPFYGAEAFGLHALGRYAGDHADVEVLAIADIFRNAPLAMTTFGLGLVTLILVGGRLAHGMWRCGAVGRAGGLLAGLGLATYLPQFFGGPAIRITHGVVLGVGLLLMAWSTRRPLSGAQAAGTNPRLLSASSI